jgi:hypothetical protein
MSTGESIRPVGVRSVTRARIPLSAFRVPKGKLALTLLLHEHKGLTAVFDATDIDTWLAAFEAGMGIEMTERAESWTHVQIRELLRRALDDGSADLDTCTAAALWLALNHPFGSETVRRHVSSSLRELDRAHITLSSDARHMWGVTVSKKPVEPQVVMAAFPPGTNVCIEFGGLTNPPIPH